MNKLLFLSLLFLLSGFLFSDDSWKTPGKGPVKVFIMAGQSNMQGHGLSEHMRLAAEDPKTKDEFAPLMNGKEFIVRKDVWIAYGSRRGGLSVGYGASAEKVGPEIGFGRYMGELLNEQVLLIKTCWGGHDLKEKFLPPSKGGPGPSYTQMVNEVRDVLTNLKKYFPEYNDSKGYEIVGLVWHQAWNDMIDKAQKAENPPYKSYTERQGALLRDLRKEFNAPGMLMTVGEMGVDGGTTEGHPFRIAQRAMTLEKEFKETTRFVPTAIYWDNDEKFKSNGGYHYNGNGKIYYFKGKAMALAMYEMMPKILFSDLRTKLDANAKNAYTAIVSKRYGAAAQALDIYKKYVDSQKGVLADKQYDTLLDTYEVIFNEYNKVVEPAVKEITTLKNNKDWYGLGMKYKNYAVLLKGVPSFDEAVKGLDEEMRNPAVANEIRTGKIFYDYVLRIQGSELRNKNDRTQQTVNEYSKFLDSYIIKKSPDSVYSKASRKLLDEVANLKTPLQEPQYYLNGTENK